MQAHEYSAHAIREIIYLILALTNSWLDINAWQVDK